MAFNLKDKKNGKTKDDDKEKKVLHLKHDQAIKVAQEIIRAHNKKARKEKKGSLQKAVEKFQEDGSLIRLNNLISMIYLLRAQSNRIMAEVEILLDRGNLVYGQFKNRLNRVYDAEDVFFNLLKELREDGDKGYDFMRDSDRFDVDFYNYMGIKQGWKPGEDSSFSSFIGVQNLIHVSQVSKGEGRKMLLGRNNDGSLWIADNDQCEHVYNIPKEWFPNIKPLQTMWVNIEPILKM